MLDTYSILSDNYQAGVLCAEQLMSVRDEDRIILPEHVSASSGVERIQGFRDALAGRKGVTVLASGESDGHTENAMPVMEALLRQAPEADLLMALNGPSAFGGLAAIEGAGLSGRFLICSVDGAPEAKAQRPDPDAAGRTPLPPLWRGNAGAYSLATPDFRAASATALATAGPTRLSKALGMI